MAALGGTMGFWSVSLLVVFAMAIILIISSDWFEEVRQ